MFRTLLPFFVLAAIVSGAARPAFAPAQPFLMDRGSPLAILSAEYDSRDALMVVLGELAFKSELLLRESPLTSVGIQPTCDSCHPDGGAGQKVFFEGLSDKPGNLDVTNRAVSLIEDGLYNPLNIPSLRGNLYTEPFARDGRFLSVRDFTLFAILNEFAGGDPSEIILEALDVFQATIPFPENALLGEKGELIASAPEAARRGEALFRRPFVGTPDLSCATCHVPEGNFVDHKIHEVGTGEGGKAGKAFETPTLRDTAETAPYLHNGRLDTLAEVVAYFDTYFAAEYSAEERADLTAYLEAVGGGTIARPSGNGSVYPITAADLLNLTLGAEDWLSTKMVVRQSSNELADWRDAGKGPSREIVNNWIRHLRRIDGFVNASNFEAAREEMGLLRQAIVNQG